MTLNTFKTSNIDVSLPQDLDPKTTFHAFALSAKSRECTEFVITPFAMSEADVERRRSESTSKVEIDGKNVLLKDTDLNHRVSFKYACGFQLACHNCYDYWFLLNQAYISHGKIWDYTQSSITEARFLESLRMGKFIRIVVCHMQYSVKNGHGRDEND